jgi:hypothetical protein
MSMDPYPTDEIEGFLKNPPGISLTLCVALTLKKDEAEIVPWINLAEWIPLSLSQSRKGGVRLSTHSNSVIIHITSFYL